MRCSEVIVLSATTLRTAWRARGLTVPRTHLLWRLHHDGPMTRARAAQNAPERVAAQHQAGLVDGLPSATGFPSAPRAPSEARAGGRSS